MSSGSDIHHQCGDNVQWQNNHATNLTDSHHAYSFNHYPHTSHNPDHTDHGPGHAGHSLDSQCHDIDQYSDSTALSPTGYREGEDFLGLSLTRQQIKEHNVEMGWQQWITLKGNIYDTTRFRDHFIAYNKKKKAAENASEQKALSDCTSSETINHQEHSNEYQVGRCSVSDTADDLLQGHDFFGQDRQRNIGAEDKEDDDTEEEYDEDEDCRSENSSSDAEFLWKYNVITALQKTGLSMNEIETEIRPFQIGKLQNPALPRWKYWNNIRTDIIALCDDITSKDSADLGKYEQEYLALLQRWLRKYRDIDPVEKIPGGDGNISVFFLTEDPDSLREWMKTSLPFDTELPDSGAWVSSELLLSPLGDTHDVFSAALRSHDSKNDPFSHDIQGKVAWAELPHDVIKNDQMTHNQLLVYESRLRRGDRVHDPTLMKKRRERLGNYFRKKYRYSEKKIAEYLQWAVVMEQNQRDLDVLCHGHV